MRYLPSLLYPNNLKNWLLGRAKAPGIEDRKGVCISLILTPLRSSIRGSFRAGPKTNFLGCLGISCFLSVLALAQGDETKEEFFPSTFEQIAALSSQPNYLVGGVVSPLSGQPVLRQTDLVVNGAQSISLSRTYIPPYMPCSFPNPKHGKGDWDNYYLYKHLDHSYKGWRFYPHVKLQFTPRTKTVLLTDPNGMSLEFKLSGPGNSVTTLASPHYGLSNTAGDVPSGQYDPRNTRIAYDENGGKITVYVPDGTVRFYYKNGSEAKTAHLYLLEKERLPNGKIVKYHFTFNGAPPDSIESFDPKEHFSYASLHITGSLLENSCHFISSTSQTADYIYQNRLIDATVSEKYNGKKSKQDYHFTCPSILTYVSAPSYREESLDYSDNLLLSSYSGKTDIFIPIYSGFGQIELHHRVHKLTLPVGQNNAFVPVYELSYQPPIAGQKEGMTTVKNSDGTTIVHHFSKNLLTTKVQYFGQDGQLKKEKIFSWDDKNWLQSIAITDGRQKILYKKSYEYDRFGNPILETLFGNFTGAGAQESFTIRRAFSDDGKNLLLQEESEDGKVICFSYLPNTNLITSKLTKAGDKVLLREFFLYDDCNNLIQKTTDDGDSIDRHWQTTKNFARSIGNGEVG